MRAQSADWPGHRMNPRDRHRVGLAFGTALRAARKRTGLTQEQLADALRLPPSTLVDATVSKLRKDGHTQKAAALADPEPTRTHEPGLPGRVFPCE